MNRGKKLQNEKIKNVRSLMYKEVRGYWAYILFSFVCVLGLQLIGLLPPQVMRLIIDNYIPSGDLPNAYASIAILCGIPVFSTLINIFYTSKNAIAARRFGFKLKREVFYNMMKQPMSFFDKSNSGELTSYCGKEINNFIAFWLLDIPSLAANALTALVTLIILLKINYTITLFQILSVPILLIPSRWIATKMRSLTTVIWDQNAKANHIINESFAGIRLVKASNIEGQRIKLLEGIQERISKIWGKAIAWERLAGDWAQQLVSAAFTGLGFAMGAIQVIQGNLTIGALIAYVTYLPKIHNVIISLASYDINLQKQLGEHAKTFEFLGKATEDEFVDDHVQIPDKNDESIISMKNISFTYPASDKKTLNGVSFDIAQGEFIGIVGPSGSGKSTIFDLLLKFYSPDGGMIQMKGVNISDLPSEKVRKLISVVSQDTFLFSGTLRENLLVIKPDSSDTDLYEAIRLANFTSVVDSLPQGLDTEIGENGAKLSGGEKQRLALARALLSDSRILLLDEATASLDSVSEAGVRSAIHEIIAKRDVTVIAIAHRVNFLRDATRILVLENGSIIDVGTFDELNGRNDLVNAYMNAKEA